MIFGGIPFWVASVIAIASAAILVGLHLLQRNYSRVVVPTLIFWQSVLQISLYNRIWRKFRHWLTFALLLLIAVLLTFSMSRPFISSSGVSHKNTIILDCRASMGIIDAGLKETRFDRARSSCEELIKNSSDFDKTMLIAVGNSAEVLKGFNDSKVAALYALKDLSITQSYSVEPMRQAMDLAVSSSKGAQQNITVLTDHANRIEVPDAAMGKNIHIRNFGGPVANASILSSGVYTSASGDANVVLKIGYWGPKAVDASIEVLKDETAVQKQSISLSPNTVTECILTVKRSPQSEYSARLVCDDGFKEDNQIQIQKNIGRKIYMKGDPCVGLKAFFDSDVLSLYVKSAADADLSVIRSSDNNDIALPNTVYIIENGQPLLSAAKVIPTSRLYNDQNKREAAGNELYVVAGSTLTALPRDAVAVLATEDGRALAAVGTKNRIFLADSLFNINSTFWKQPQFPELMQQIINAAQSYSGEASSQYSMQIQPEYADLWNVKAAGDSDFADGSKTPEPLYKYILLAVVLLLGIEIYAFYKGVIV